MRLLIIDDSRLDRKTIKRLLVQAKGDTSVAEATDVESALGMVAVEHFDCILIDYHLPGSDGVALAGQIAASHGGITTPMVMLTAEPTPALAEQALDSGLVDFMSKRNLSAEHLRQTLANAIIKHQADKRRAAEDKGDNASAHRLLFEKDEIVAQALALLTSSKAIQHCLADDEDVQIALDLLEKATTMQPVH
jgi:CheY-like chemotaxis protein